MQTSTGVKGEIASVMQKFQQLLHQKTVHVQLKALKATIYSKLFNRMHIIIANFDICLICLWYLLKSISR